MAIECRRQQ